MTRRTPTVPPGNTPLSPAQEAAASAIADLLLADLSRHPPAPEATPSLPIYYFGRWGGPGHFLWTPDGRNDERAPLPWTPRELDTLCGDPALADHRGRRAGEPLYWPGDEVHQPQGDARLHHRDGWTALAWWDRSGDARWGSNSAFVAPGTRTAEELARMGAEAFHAVWARVEAAGGLRLPGSAAPR